MKKSKMFFISIILLCFSSFIWGASIWLEQMERAFDFDLSLKESRVNDTWSGGNANDTHMVGDIGCDNLDSSIKSIVVNISAPDGFYFRTPKDVSVERPYVIQVFARGNKGDGNGDGNISSSGITCKGSGIENTVWGSDIVESTKAGWVTDNGELTMVIGTEYSAQYWGESSGTYDRVHIDCVLTLPELSSIDDLYRANDYSTTMNISVRTCTTADGVTGTLESVGNLSYSIMGHYDVASEESGTMSFTITPSSYASFYPLDDSDVTSTATTVGSIYCFSNSYSDATNNPEISVKADLPYAIVLSASQDYTIASNNFQFVNSVDTTKTIPYKAQIIKSSDYASHSFTIKDDVFCESTTTSLTGTEAVSLSSESATDRRFILVPQEDCGTNGGNHYYRFWYKGDIQILLDASERQKIANKTYPSGTYKTTLYLSLVSR